MPTTALGPPVTAETKAGAPLTVSASYGGADASVSVPAGALPAGTTVALYPVASPSVLTADIPVELSYVTAFCVLWNADGATPTAASPVTLAMTDADIDPGASVVELSQAGRSAIGTLSTGGGFRISLRAVALFLVAQRGWSWCGEHYIDYRSYYWRRQTDHGRSNHHSDDVRRTAPHRPRPHKTPLRRHPTQVLRPPRPHKTLLRRHPTQVLRPPRSHNPAGEAPLHLWRQRKDSLQAAATLPGSRSATNSPSRVDELEQRYPGCHGYHNAKRQYDNAK